MTYLVMLLYSTAEVRQSKRLILTISIENVQSIFSLLLCYIQYFMFIYCTFSIIANLTIQKYLCQRYTVEKQFQTITSQIE